MPTTTDIATTGATPLAEKVKHAELLAASSMLPKHLQNPPNLLWMMEVAESLDLTLAQAVNGVVVINQVPSLKAETMRALVLRSGHRFRVDAQTGDECTVSVARREYPDDVQTFSYTTADAQRAGLGGANWQKHPKAMLLARATSAACRAVFPDVIQGFYSPEEVADFAPPRPHQQHRAPAHVDVDVEVVDVEVVDHDPPASTQDLKALGDAAAACGLVEPGEVHDAVVSIIGRDIASAADLTAGEADACTRRFTQVAAGQAGDGAEAG